MDRERERTTSNIVNGHISKDGVPTVFITQDSDARSEVMRDTVTENFRARIKSGEIISNSMFYQSIGTSHSEICSNQREVDVRDPYPVWEWSGVNVTAYYLENVYQIYNLNPCPPLSQAVDLVGIAKQVCLAKVDKTPTAFFEDVGEIRETLRFLKNPLASMQRLTNAIVNEKRRLSALPRTLETIQAMADVWLTYRFALSPLLRSATDLMDALATKPVKHVERRTSHGRSEDEESMDTPLIVRPTPSNPPQVIVYELDGYRSVDHHATILYEVTNPLNDWRYQYGLRKKDIPVTLWELAPRSFMIDRVLHIKNMISGIVNFLDPSVSFLAGSFTTRTLNAYTTSMTSHEHALYTITTDAPDNVLNSSFIMERANWIPSLWDASPNWTPMGLVDEMSKILDLLAMLANTVPSSKF
jgi:hypothetical protein